jgi:hypothetical protein
VTGEDPPVDRVVPCPDCRALVAAVDGPTHAYIGGNAGCWEAWGELQARAYADPALAAVMPLAVDAYAAQHHGVEGRRQAQSVWAHLVSICAILERGRSPGDGIRLKQELSRDDPVFPWLEPPADPGAVTVLDVAVASSSEAAAAVWRWAASVWATWVAHRQVIRARADELVSGGGRDGTAPTAGGRPRGGRPLRARAMKVTSPHSVSGGIS